LICWEITDDAVDDAAAMGADPLVAAWARGFVNDRD
jgi:hypothetical protein